MARAGQDCSFPHPRAGPEVSSQSSQSISSARYLNRTGSYAALLALEEKQHQALSHLERELVRAGSRRATPRGSCCSLGAGNASTSTTELLGAWHPPGLLRAAWGAFRAGGGSEVL